MSRSGLDTGPSLRPPATLIGSVQRAMRLLEAAADHGAGAPAKMLAREAGLHHGTAYHLIRTLVYEGYLQRLDDGCYVLTDQVASLAGRSGHQVALAHVRPALMALRDQARAACYLSLYEDGEIVVRVVMDSPATPRVDLWVGFHEAGHATALGKSVLASLDGPARRDYLGRHRLADLTPRTITDPKLLLRSLPQDGSELAVDHEEYALGTVCGAAAVVAPWTVGSVAISLPARRLPELPRLRPLMLRTASRISRALALTI